ncbi:hypothetical protein E0379_01010 [Campylobacter upsaliensis]|uniref:Small hydrophobic protein n=1 Tax=Campylobacter upsaliensis TaxID=28080 RepID=A0A5M1DSC9_CAMUP|nr:hypothetical protein [Campylobacter upsaliensis]MDL0114089.1 hypothetical protein [Campylobacter felis]EAI0686430.1 hypothetical protein [Campylobacter upsaliensis]EAI2900249.1 hypothetical protein [Campylobacter upsaliensis]EAI9944181.1 hypothetical protein [Campylobacter upsaliensis]ECJ8453690.1 hypothetical protein [Campylobacter upsaliensis]
MLDFILILILDYTLYFSKVLEKVFLGRVIFVFLFVIFIILFCVEGLLFHLFLILALSLLLYLFLSILLMKFS